jgi:protein disulfide-isomerase A6
MKPAWEKLGKKYQDSKTTVIGDVDCTVHEELCSRFEVQGFPTVKYFKGDDAQDYEGGRSFDDLAKFTEDELTSPICTVDSMDACNDDQKALIEKWSKASAQERADFIEKSEQEIKDADAAHEKLVEGLQAQYEKSMEDTAAKKKELRAPLGLVKGIKSEKSEL